MRIGELAQQAGVTTKALRFYEQAGVLPEPARSPSGYRNYDETALARLRFIKGAQAAGLTIAEIVQIVAVREAQGPPCAHVSRYSTGTPSISTSASPSSSRPATTSSGCESAPPS